MNYVTYSFYVARESTRKIPLKCKKYHSLWTADITNLLAQKVDHATTSSSWNTNGMTRSHTHDPLSHTPLNHGTQLIFSRRYFTKQQLRSLFETGDMTRSHTHDTLERTHGHQRQESDLLKRHRGHLENGFDGVVVGVSDYHLLFSLHDAMQGEHFFSMKLSAEFLATAICCLCWMNLCCAKANSIRGMIFPYWGQSASAPFIALRDAF